VQTYDFRRPNKFSREYVRALQIVGETFARQFSTVLGTTLRSISHVTLRSVEQQTYDDYVRSLPNPSYLAVLSLAPLTTAGLFHLELGVATAMIERLLGGNGMTAPPKRPLTEIEESLVRGVMERSLRELEYAFESLVALESHVVQQESNPQFAQIAAPSDMAVVMTLDVKVGEQVGSGSICIPFPALQPVLEAFASSSMFVDRDPSAQAEFARRLELALLDVPMRVKVKFDPVSLRSGDIVGLEVGDVVPLHHPVERPLTMTIGNVDAFRVVAGRRGKRLGCVVTEEEKKFS
jgi:flagellar motor switch protein FliM